jgi:purine-binding chemotaxis protein CheW
MSDARKRAQRKKGSAPARPLELPVAAAAGEWVSRAESLVFPAESPAPVASGRIALPSSGLAEDILARAEAAGVDAAPAWTAAAAPAAQAMVPAPAPEDASRIHNISFFAAPNREEKKAIEATEHLVTFFLAQEEYGVDVRLVQEIIRVADITQVPRAPEFIRGVINLRGRIIPVVDLKRRLALGVVEASRVARIVVVKVRDRLTGLLVDGASQVLKVPVSTIEAAPEEVVEIDVNYIRGVAKLEKRLIILVDLNKILAPDVKEGAALMAPA